MHVFRNKALGNVKYCDLISRFIHNFTHFFVFICLVADVLWTNTNTTNFLPTKLFTFWILMKFSKWTFVKKKTISKIQIIIINIVKAPNFHPFLMVIFWVLFWYKDYTIRNFSVSDNSKVFHIFLMFVKYIQSFC